MPEQTGSVQCNYFFLLQSVLRYNKKATSTNKKRKESWTSAFYDQLHAIASYDFASYDFASYHQLQKNI